MQKRTPFLILIMLFALFLSMLNGCRQQAQIPLVSIIEQYHTEKGILNPHYVLTVWAENTYDEKCVLDKQIEGIYAQISNGETEGRIYNNLGKQLYLRCRLEEAQDAFKKAIQSNPNDQESYYLLGCTYFFTKKYDLSKKNFIRSKQLGMRIDPHTVDFFRKTAPQVVGLYRARLNFNIEKPYEKKGLHCVSLEDVLNLENNEIDMATFGLLASHYVSEKLYGKPFEINQYKETIDALVDEILAEIGGEKRPEWIITAINRKLFFDYKFQAPAEDTANSNYESYNLMHFLIDYRQGVCMSLSLLYLSIAQRSALPVYGVVAPGHFFVRYDDQGTMINIETTQRGKSASNDDYYKQYPNLDSEETLYFKNLTNKETIGCYLNNLGTLFINKKNYDEGIKLLRFANICAPHFSEPYINIGKAYLDMRQYDEAIKAFSDGLLFNKRHSQLLKGLGIVYFQTQQYDKALEELKIAVAVNGKDSVIHYYIGKIYQIQNRHSDAILEFREALALEPDLVEYNYQIAQSYYMVEQYDLAWKHINSIRKQGVRVDPEFLKMLRDMSPEPHIVD